MIITAALCTAVGALRGSGAAGQAALSGEPIRITRAQGPITIDGQLDDEGWHNATQGSKWYETNPGDNTEPAVKSLAWTSYDDRFFYAEFDFSDTNPRAIR